MLSSSQFPFFYQFLYGPRDELRVASYTLRWVFLRFLSR